MNNAERRLHEIEERLEGVAAPEPPPELLASIQEEIPPLLGQTEGPAQPTTGWRWRRLAASLAVLAVGGMLGYKLFVDGPSPADTIAGEAPTRPAPSMSEALEPAEPDTEEPEAINAPPAAVEPPAREAPAAGAPATVREIGAAVDASGQLESGSVEVRVRDSRGDSIPGSKVTLRGDGEPKVRVTGADGEAEFEGLEAGDYALQAELDGFVPVEQRLRAVDERTTRAEVVLEPAAENVIVTSESPLLDRTKDEIGEAEPAPGRADDSRYNARVGAENRRIAQMRAEAEALERELAALGKSRPQERSVPKPMVADPTSDEPPTAPYARRRAPSSEAMVIAPAPPSTGGTAEPNDEAWGDMFFQGYGTNPFVDTEDDAQSTFGIDVDTASYTLARSYLRRGSLPPADAIRVEEFVNYFDYGDPAPRRKDFAVVAEGAPSPFAATARTYLLRFALKGREISAAQRRPAVLTFVVDVSGSMNRENRLGLVQGALRLLVDQLDSGDAIGLVVYGSSGRVILEPTSDHRRVLAAIDALRPGGSTNAEEGLVLGYRTARRHFRPGAINRVILCSDGVANVGRTGPESILARIAREAEEGIELTTVGFGMGNYNDVLMEQLADKGDGNYTYVDDLDAARRVFVENLTGTLQTIAADAKIQVEFDRQVVQSYRLLGYENRDIADRDFRNDAVDAGEIGGGHQVTALYEVKLRPDGPPRGRVATLRLRYHSKRSQRVVEDSVDLTLADLAPRWSRASDGLRLAATAAEFAEILKGSYWAKESDLGALAERARRLSRRGARGDEVAELVELIERAARLRGEGLVGGSGDGGDGIER